MILPDGSKQPQLSASSWLASWNIAARITNSYRVQRSVINAGQRA